MLQQFTPCLPAVLRLPSRLALPPLCNANHKSQPGRTTRRRNSFSADCVPSLLETGEPVRAGGELVAAVDGQLDRGHGGEGAEPAPPQHHLYSAVQPCIQFSVKLYLHSLG